VRKEYGSWVIVEGGRNWETTRKKESGDADVRVCGGSCCKVPRQARALDPNAAKGEGISGAGQVQDSASVTGGPQKEFPSLGRGQDLKKGNAWQEINVNRHTNRRVTKRSSKGGKEPWVRREKERDNQNGGPRNRGNRARKRQRGAKSGPLMTATVMGEF